MNSNFTFLKVKFTFFCPVNFPEEKKEKVKEKNETKKVKEKTFFLKRAHEFLIQILLFFK